MASIRTGISARSQEIREGIACSINYVKGREPDGSFALDLLQQMRDATQGRVGRPRRQDSAVEAAIQGIYMQLEKLNQEE